MSLASFKYTHFTSPLQGEVKWAEHKPFPQVIHPMNFDIITLFPEFFNSSLECGTLRIARQKGLISLGFTNPRDFTEDGFVDDYQFGGGGGMVLKPEPVVKAVNHVRRETSRLIYLTPKGRLLNQGMVQELAKEQHIVFICGRYKGIDERINQLFNPSPISIGDYILAGGETAALVVIEAITRLIPGVLGNKDSAESDSLQGGLLEPPIYTRPDVYKKLEVPRILKNGNHRAIFDWRRRESLKITLDKRPDLIPAEEYTTKDLEILLEVLNDKDSSV